MVKISLLKNLAQGFHSYAPGLMSGTVNDLSILLFVHTSVDSANGNESLKMVCLAVKHDRLCCSDFSDCSHTSSLTIKLAIDDVTDE